MRFGASFADTVLEKALGQALGLRGGQLGWGLTPPPGFSVALIAQDSPRLPRPASHGKGLDHPLPSRRTPKKTEREKRNSRLTHRRESSDY